MDTVLPLEIGESSVCFYCARVYLPAPWYGGSDAKLSPQLISAHEILSRELRGASPTPFRVELRYFQHV